MYSMVILAALGGSVDVPDMGRRRGGCHGGYGGCYGGCYGGGYGGCCGGGYGGCYGGCYGGGYGGCWGGYSGYGGGGYRMAYGGGGWGGAMYAAGNPYFGETMYFGGATYPGATMANGATYYSSNPYVPVSFQQNGVPRTEDRQVSTGDTRPPGDAMAPATIVVRLPADAKLTIDDNPTQSTSDERRFVSPPLPPGREFRYVLKASIVRKGETVTATQNVMVRAGKESEVTLEFPGANARGD
jgi:uncharacterized protein (TIGR03000 family)